MRLLETIRAVLFLGLLGLAPFAGTALADVVVLSASKDATISTGRAAPASAFGAAVTVSSAAAVSASRRMSFPSRRCLRSPGGERWSIVAEVE